MAGITHYWEGTKLFITSDSGTSGCDLIGPKGDMGVRGPQGIPGIGSGSGSGTAGADGVSPTITITTISGGHRVTITDVNGTQSFDVMDGSSATVDLGDYYNKEQVDAAITEAINNIDVPDSTPVATTSTVGTVKPDGTTIYVADDGTITAIGQGAEVQEVYVGTEEPTDPNILIWLNPNDEVATVAASTDYVNAVVGDFSEALDTVNGEVV